MPPGGEGRRARAAKQGRRRATYGRSGQRTAAVRRVRTTIPAPCSPARAGASSRRSSFWGFFAPSSRWLHTLAARRSERYQRSLRTRRLPSLRANRCTWGKGPRRTIRSGVWRTASTVSRTSTRFPPSISRKWQWWCFSSCRRPLSAASRPSLSRSRRCLRTVPPRPPTQPEVVDSGFDTSRSR